jgi:ABC-2 type transport system ATP-binding protein
MSSCDATCGRWCAGLREPGVTIILTTHYIEEAEEMADRIGVIRKGELILVEEKAALMREARAQELTVTLKEPLVRPARVHGGAACASWMTERRST